jgi:hypothetical protein
MVAVAGIATSTRGGVEVSPTGTWEPGSDSMTSARLFDGIAVRTFFDPWGRFGLLRSTEGLGVKFLGMI